jgi:hypothetical protein
MGLTAVHDTAVAKGDQINGSAFAYIAHCGGEMKRERFHMVGVRRKSAMAFFQNTTRMPLLGPPYWDFQLQLRNTMASSPLVAGGSARCSGTASLLRTSPLLGSVAGQRPGPVVAQASHSGYVGLRLLASAAQ